MFDPAEQEKASARMLSVPVGQAGRRYLLKVDPPEYPHVVENEAYFISLARRARSRVPPDAGRQGPGADHLGDRPLGRALGVRVHAAQREVPVGDAHAAAHQVRR